MGTLNNLAGVDLTQVSTKYPVIAVGIYPWRISESKVEPTKSDPNKNKLALKLELEGTALDKNDQPLQPGYALSKDITLTPSDKRTTQMIVRDICEVIDAAYGETFRKGLGSLENFDTDMLQGQVVMAKTAIDPENGQWPEKAVLARFIAKDESAVVPPDAAAAT